MDRIPGQATHDGTREYLERFPQVREARGFRGALGLELSSIGIGTYLGEVSKQQDAGYKEALETALAGAINVVDTAINYRHQRSERVVGKALRSFIENGGSREEVFLATKGGYLPLDADVQDPHRKVQQDYVDPGLGHTRKSRGGRPLHGTGVPGGPDPAQPGQPGRGDD